MQRRLDREGLVRQLGPSHWPRKTRTNPSLVERIDATTARLIGYISVRAFDDVAEPVAKGETYRPEEDGYNWTSRADNLVAEPEDL